MKTKKKNNHADDRISIKLLYSIFSHLFYYYYEKTNMSKSFLCVHCCLPLLDDCALDIHVIISIRLIYLFVCFLVQHQVVRDRLLVEMIQMRR